MTRADKTEALRLLYHYACGYCGTTETQAGGILSRDHFVPLAQGGRDSLGNLVYACETCNRAKGNYDSRGDAPETRLLHPLTDDLTAHVAPGADGLLIAQTPLGQTFIAVLNLNRAALVAARRTD
ncbi:MAG: HNH endonuclease [Armatimonadetes bacterium]|nr:HNH endonuclease [Armatimonadota bacterium]